jgi:hypothetical protein
VKKLLAQGSQDDECFMLHIDLNFHLGGFELKYSFCIQWRIYDREVMNIKMLETVMEKMVLRIIILIEKLFGRSKSTVI